MSNLIVYALVDPRNNEVRYIGKSGSGMKRVRMHMCPSSLARGRTYKDKWLRELIASGYHPLVRTIAVCADKKDLSKAEILWIAYARSLGWRLTNLTSGGEGSFGLVKSPETRAKIANANRGRKHTPEAVTRMREAKKDHVISPETRAKMVASRKANYVISDETRNKMSEAHKKQIITKETRAKMAATRRGFKHSEEAKAKMKGRKVSEETKTKISLANTGRKNTVEAKEKMSAARKLYLERKKERIIFCKI